MCSPMWIRKLRPSMNGETPSASALIPTRMPKLMAANWPVVSWPGGDPCRMRYSALNGIAASRTGFRLKTKTSKNATMKK